LLAKIAEMIVKVSETIAKIPEMIAIILAETRYFRTAGENWLNSSTAQ